MNVKTNDIAMIINTQFNRGRLVRVVKSIGGGWWQCELLQTFEGVNGATFPPGLLSDTHDSILRPLHDGDGVDEVIKKVGLPPPVYLPTPDWVNNPIHERETIPCWWVTP